MLRSERYLVMGFVESELKQFTVEIDLLQLTISKPGCNWKHSVSAACECCTLVREWDETCCYPASGNTEASELAHVLQPVDPIKRKEGDWSFTVTELSSKSYGIKHCLLVIMEMVNQYHEIALLAASMSGSRSWSRALFWMWCTHYLCVDKYCWHPLDPVPNASHLAALSSLGATPRFEFYTPYTRQGWRETQVCFLDSTKHSRLRDTDC